MTTQPLRERRLCQPGNAVLVHRREYAADPERHRSGLLRQPGQPGTKHALGPFTGTVAAAGRSWAELGWPSWRGVEWLGTWPGGAWRRALRGACTGWLRRSRPGCRPRSPQDRSTGRADRLAWRACLGHDGLHRDHRSSRRPQLRGYGRVRPGSLIPEGQLDLGSRPGPQHLPFDEGVGGRIPAAPRGAIAF